MDSLVEAMRAFESIESRLSSAYIRAQVQRFDVLRFKSEMSEFIAGKMSEFLCARQGTRGRISV